MTVKLERRLAKQLEKRLLVIAKHLNAESMVRRRCAKIGSLAKSALRAHRILVDVGFGIITHWTNNRQARNTGFGGAIF